MSTNLSEPASVAPQTDELQQWKEEAGATDV